MMKLWLVRQYEIELQEVLAVCTELEIAKQIMVGLGEPPRMTDYVIEEWDTDRKTEGVEVDAVRGKGLFDD